MTGLPTNRALQHKWRHSCQRLEGMHLEGSAHMLRAQRACGEDSPEVHIEADDLDGAVLVVPSKNEDPSVFNARLDRKELAPITTRQRWQEAWRPR